MRLADIALKTTDTDGAFRVYAIGDLHADHRAFQKQRFCDYRDQIAADTASIAVFVGDLIEGRVPGQKNFDPSVLRKPFLNNLDEYYGFSIWYVKRLFQPLVDAGVPIVFVRGNHDRKAEYVGLSPMVAGELGAHYLGDSGFVRVRSGSSRANGKDALYTTVIHATHGSGGGKTPGPKVNDMEIGNRWIEADIHIKGHLHDGDLRVIPRVGVASKGDLTIRERKIALYRAPAFVAPHLYNVDDYAQRENFAPGDRGLQYLGVNPRSGSMRRYECDF